MEPVADGHSEACEGLLVAVLRSNHEIGIHASPAGPGLRKAGPLTRYGRVDRRQDSIVGWGATSCAGCDARNAEAAARWWAAASSLVGEPVFARR